MAAAVPRKMWADIEDASDDEYDNCWVPRPVITEESTPKEKQESTTETEAPVAAAVAPSTGTRRWADLEDDDEVADEEARSEQDGSEAPAGSGSGVSTAASTQPSPRAEEIASKPTSWAAMAAAAASKVETKPKAVVPRPSVPAQTPPRALQPNTIRRPVHPTPKSAVSPATPKVTAPSLAQHIAATSCATAPGKQGN